MSRSLQQERKNPSEAAVCVEQSLHRFEEKVNFRGRLDSQASRKLREVRLTSQSSIYREVGSEINETWLATKQLTFESIEGLGVRNEARAAPSWHGSLFPLPLG